MSTRLLVYFIHSPASPHRPKADGDEWDAQYLSHVDGQAGLEGLLYFFGVFYQKAESEDEREAKTEVEAAAGRPYR